MHDLFPDALLLMHEHLSQRLRISNFIRMFPQFVVSMSVFYCLFKLKSHDSRLVG